MDADHFDALARSLSMAASSRRRLLAGLAGSALAAVATAVGIAATEATHFDCRHVGKRCNGGAQCCSGICKRHKCRAHDKGICTAAQDSCGLAPVECGANGAADCLCYVTSGGASFCGGDSTIVIACREDKECETIHGAGAACIPCGPNMFCVARCPVPT